MLRNATRRFVFTLKPYLISKPLPFHTCHNNNQKLFTETENQYAHNLLLRHSTARPVPKNLKTILFSMNELDRYLDRNWRAADINSIVRAFDTIKDLCKDKKIDLSHEKFDGLVDGLLSNLEYLTDDGLLSVMESLEKMPPTPRYDSRNFHAVWSALDDVCFSKMKQWDVDTMFVFADKWFRLNLAKKSDYVYELLDKLSQKPHKLTKDQFVRLFFFYNVSRRKSIPFDVENALQDHVPDMSAEDLAVVALGYFKTETKIKSDMIINEMGKRIIEKADSIHEMSLTALLKVIRFSERHNCADIVSEIMKCMVPEIGRLSNMCCVHLALLGSNIQMYDPNILTAVTKKMLVDIKDPNRVRLKDIERLLLVLSMFNWRPKVKPDIYEASVKELRSKRRAMEIQLYPRCLISALHYLSMVNIYPYDLLNYVLDPNVIRDVYGKANNVGREILSLDCSIEAECPDYRGHRLNIMNRCKAAKWHCESIPAAINGQATVTDHRKVDFQALADTMRLKEKYCTGHVSSHYYKPEAELADPKTQRLFLLNKYNAAKWPIEYVPVPTKKKPSAASRLLIDVSEALVELTKDKRKIFVGHILPHFSKPDLVVCKNKQTGEYVTPGGLEKPVFGEFRKPYRNDGYTWYALIVVGINQTVRNSNEVVGQVKMKERQLRSIGYLPVYVLWMDFLKLSTIQERKRYLRKQILKAI